MGNRLCPKCGQEYSDTYRNCPFCEEEDAERKGKPLRRHGGKRLSKRKRSGGAGGILLLVMAVVTYLIRMLPMALCTGRLKSRFVRSFLFYVPYAVLGAMTFPAIFTSTGSELSAALGCAVALVLAYFGRGLLTVALCSCLTVYLAEWAMAAGLLG